MKHKVKVILQARTGSERLYGKVLLPIIKDEMVVLCWKRIKVSNYDAVVAIPDKSEDDYLAEVLKKNKIEFFRGSSDNVFSRFKKITSNMNSEDIVVRVTADNPIVDGYLINRLVKEYNDKKYLYFSSHDNLLNSPYGLQVEIFKVRHLREKFKKNKFNLEHVTPIIRKKYLSKNKLSITGLKKFKGLRITVDNFKDLNRTNDIFKASFFDEKKNYLELLNNFYKKEIKIKKIKINSKIVLGTVQLGKKYFSNSSITQNRANKILQLAHKKGINFLDTAFEYGKAEKFIGKFSSEKKIYFNISTKLKKLRNNTNKMKIRYEIDKSIFTSLKNLRTYKLDTFLIHDSNILFKSKFVHTHILKFINCGIIKNFGVSIYTLDEFLKARKYKKLNCAQIPFNILDYKWKDILNVRNKNFKIFVRSIFLRGNLKKKNIIFPFYKTNNKKLVNELNNLVKKFKKKDLLDMSIAYIKSFKGIDFYILGVQNQLNLKSTLNYFNTKPFGESEKNIIIKTVQRYFNAEEADLRRWN